MTNESPPGEEAGPLPKDRPHHNLNTATIPVQLRRRRDASRRLPAFCGCGHRDPLAHRVGPDGPSTFGLTDSELRRHFRELVRDGWTPAEIETVLDMSRVTR